MKETQDPREALRELASRRCRERRAGQGLTQQQIELYLRLLPGWAQQEQQISKTCRFDDFNQTMAFVNAVAWIANAQNHHPDMEVGYSRCAVHFTTHSVGGLSENDFICAAQIENLLK
jgi:4a-hydroxytetrahydrobiopterin dehydratase